MERQIQKTGKRPWGGADLIKLQDELYEALESLLRPYNKDFVISGCEMNGSGPYTFSPGIVFIDGNICRFSGAQVSSLPAFLNKQIIETAIKTYGDGINKATEKHYVAVVGDDNSPNIELPTQQNTISGLIAPLTDGIQNNSNIGASAKSVYLLHQTLISTMPGTVQTDQSSLADMEYRLADGIVQVKITFPNQSPLQGALIYTFPAGYRPLDNILLSISSGAMLKIAPNGQCTLFNGNISAEPNHFYYLEFPTF